MLEFVTVNNLADLLGVPRKTVESWIKNGRLHTERNAKGQEGFSPKQLAGIPAIDAMVRTNWNEELSTKPRRAYASIELFAGGGGLALGMAKAGFHHILLNEFNREACATLRLNRPDWNIVERDIREISFKEYEGKVDFLSLSSLLLRGK